jgi:cytochrome c biogenesis protein CcmG, thiol:disulfide interchange protein DsbE
MKRWLALIPLAVLIAGAGMFWSKSLHRQVQYQPTELVGQMAPAVVLQPLGGGDPAPLNAVIKGQPYMINVFGSWCVACVVEHPQLVELKSRGLKIVGVAWRDQPQKTQAFLNQRGDPFAVVLMDPSGLAAVDLGITAAPESYLIDSTGKVIFKQTGPIPPEMVDEIMKRAGAA